VRKYSACNAPGIEKEPDVNCFPEDQTDYGSIVRNNLMKKPKYTPYCGRDRCFRRTRFDGEQFACTCGFRTSFPEAFIDTYTARWASGEKAV